MENSVFSLPSRITEKDTIEKTENKQEKRKEKGLKISIEKRVLLKDNIKKKCVISV